jgi:dihydrofolate reductase
MMLAARPGPGVTLVVAMDRRGVIGQAGGLPWRLPDDLKRFKALTLGKTVIMGRKTYESIGRPLPQRRNIVISRRDSWVATGIERAGSLAAALALCAEEREVMVIGGAEIYRAALPLANKIELTRVEADVAGDTEFPPLTLADWRETARETHPIDARHDYPMSFCTLERI